MSDGGWYNRRKRRHLTADLLAYYTFNDLTDSSGNSRSLIDEPSGIATSIGTDGGAVGSNYLKGGSAIFTDISLRVVDVSVSLWVKFHGSTSINQAVILNQRLNPDDSSVPLTIRCFSSSSTKTVSLVASGDTITGDCVIDTWNHVVAVFNSGSSALYINSVLVGKSTAITAFTLTKWNIQANSSYVFIDDVAIYSKALNPYHVELLYSNGSGFNPTS